MDGTDRVEVTDYYEELGINEDSSLEDIISELNQQENRYKATFASNPDGSRKKLSLISEARKEFSNDAVRLDYDRRLEESKRKQTGQDPDAAKRAQLEQFKEDARKDLQKQPPSVHYAQQARISVEKALQYEQYENNKEDLYVLAATAYARCEETETALRYIDKAINDAPDNPVNYIDKAGLLDRKHEYDLEQDIIEIAINKAKKKGKLQGETMGYYAFFLLAHSRGSEEGIEQFARDAVSYGDSWGNASRVLEEIKKRRLEREAEANRRRAEEDARAQAAAREKRNGSMRIKTRILFFVYAIIYDFMSGVIGSIHHNMVLSTTDYTMANMFQETTTAAGAIIGLLTAISLNYFDAMRPVKRGWIWRLVADIGCYIYMFYALDPITRLFNYSGLSLLVCNVVMPAVVCYISRKKGSDRYWREIGNLVSAPKRTKFTEWELNTPLSVYEICERFMGKCQKMGFVVKDIQFNRNSMTDVITRYPEVGVYAHGKTLLGSAVVQIYIFEEGDHRFARLVAVGEPPYEEFMEKLLTDGNYKSDYRTLASIRAANKLMAELEYREF